MIKRLAYVPHLGGTLVMSEYELEETVSDQLFLAIEEKRGAPISLRPYRCGEVTVQYILGSCGLVGNMGFYSIYCQDICIYELERCMTRIGATDAAVILKQALERFDGAKLPGDPDSAIEYFGSIEAMKKEAEKYQSAYWKAIEDIQVKLDRWIAKNPQYFTSYEDIMHAFDIPISLPWWQRIIRF